MRKKKEQERGPASPEMDSQPKEGNVSCPLLLDYAKASHPVRPLGTGVLPNWRISPRAYLGSTCHSTRRFTPTSSPAC